MKMVIRRWGNSLALRIPRGYAAKTRISEGSAVELTFKSGALVIRPIVANHYSLNELLKRVTATNRHDSIGTGEAVGQEIGDESNF
jgi:antitoxin MazE